MGAEILRVPLSRGLFATIDVADEWVTQFSWSARPDGHTAYAVRAKTRQLMHRVLLGCVDAIIDHRDGNGLNNTRHNLRLATLTQNQCNRRKTEGLTSPFKGVSRCKTGKWRCSISMNNAAHRWSCVFTLEETAARAYDVKATEWFGEFARLNFPTELEASRQIVAHAIANNRHTALTEDLVLVIRRMKAEGRFASQIAAAIGANQKTVESVISGQSWKHVSTGKCS